MLKKTSIIFISVLLCYQACKAAVLDSSANDEAEDLLNQLRQEVAEQLTAAFTDYVALSDKVDAAAQDTKGNVDDALLVQCVNDQATAAITQIYSSVVDLTTTSLGPVYSEELAYITCGGLNAACVDSTVTIINEILNDWLPNNIKTKVQTASDTIDQQVSLIQACARKVVAKSQKLVAPRSVADDGNAALNKLRQVTIDNINLAAQDYTTLAITVDSATLELVASGTDEQIGCIFSHATPAVNLIGSSELALIVDFLKPLYDAETQLVICGASDAQCVNGVITDIQNGIDSTPGAVNTQVHFDTESVNVHITALKAC